MRHQLPPWQKYARQVRIEMGTRIEGQGKLFSTLILLWMREVPVVVREGNLGRW
jgi:hypothetical protein